MQQLAYIPYDTTTQRLFPNYRATTHQNHGSFTLNT